MIGPDHFIVFRGDGGVWCAAPPGFRDLVLDPVGWGDTAVAAVVDLLRHPEFDQGVKTGKWRIPVLSDFVDVPPPDGARLLSVEYNLRRTNIQAAIRRQSFRVISD